METKNNSVGKKTFVEMVHSSLAATSKRNITRETVESCLNEILENVMLCLKNKKKITFQGFGSFQLKYTKERNGINPQTREPIVVSARYRVVFTPGASLASVARAIPAKK